MVMCFPFNHPYFANMSIYLFRRKIRRNRLHLWVFLSRNPSIIQYRVKENQVDNREDQLDNDRMVQIVNREPTIDIEENKNTIQYDTDSNEESKDEMSFHFVPSINMSESSYKDKHL